MNIIMFYVIWDTENMTVYPKKISNSFYWMIVDLAQTFKRNLNDLNRMICKTWLLIGDQVIPNLYIIKTE